MLYYCVCFSLMICVGFCVCVLLCYCVCYLLLCFVFIRCITVDYFYVCVCLLCLVVFVPLVVFSSCARGPFCHDFMFFLSLPDLPRCFKMHLSCLSFWLAMWQWHTRASRAWFPASKSAATLPTWAATLSSGSGRESPMTPSAVSCIPPSLPSTPAWR